MLKFSLYFNIQRHYLTWQLQTNHCAPLIKMRMPPFCQRHQTHPKQLSAKVVDVYFPRGEVTDISIGRISRAFEAYRDLVIGDYESGDLHVFAVPV